MADSPLIDRLRARAERITDTRILQIVLAFIAGGLFVSVVAAAMAAIGEAAESWEWVAPVDAALRWLDGFSQNFSTEMIGAAITFILLEILLAGRREKEAEQREKKRLILQMGSPDNRFAVEAVHQLKTRGWLQDDLLQGAELSFANLQGAELSSANLQGAILWGANPQGSDLARADLQGAELSFTNLQEAILWGANLQRVNLSYAKLQGAILDGTDLQAANLEGANLQGAWGSKLEQLRQAESLEGATLPDGTKLPDNDSWHEVFEAWCETVEVDDYGYIVSASPDEDDEQPDDAQP